MLMTNSNFSNAEGTAITNTQRADGGAITIDFSDIFVLTPSSSSSDVAPGKY